MVSGNCFESHVARCSGEWDLPDVCLDSLLLVGDGV